MPSKNEQIQILNSEVRCTLKPSPIHGIGVFALRPIFKGQRCYCYARKGDNKIVFDLSYSALQEVDEPMRSIILGRWPQIVNGKPFLSPTYDAQLISFMNHGEANYDPQTDEALRDISEGEELLEDYKLMDNWSLAHPWLN